MPLCNNPSCNSWRLPVCQNDKSQTGCIHGNRCYFRHVEAEEEPNKKSKKGGAIGSVALVEYRQVGCVSQDSRTKVFSTESRKIETKSRRQILQQHLAP